MNLTLAANVLSFKELLYILALAAWGGLFMTILRAMFDNSYNRIKLHRQKRTTKEEVAVYELKKRELDQERIALNCWFFFWIFILVPILFLCWDFLSQFFIEGTS